MRETPIPAMLAVAALGVACWVLLYGLWRLAGALA